MKQSKQELILHATRCGWSIRRISRELGFDRETASKYVKQAGLEVRQPGRGGWEPPGGQVSAEARPKAVEAGAGPTLTVETPPESGTSDPKPARGVSPDPGPSDSKPARGVPPDPGPSDSKPARGVSPDSGRVEPGILGEGPSTSSSPAAPPKTASLCAPYSDFIEIELAKGRNGMGIWQDLVDDHGFRGKYSSVKRFIHNLLLRKPDAHPVIETEPGAEAQVDYGLGPWVRDPKTGKYRRTRLFVLTLGFSRKSVRLLVFNSSSRTWAELHEIAFRRLGGATLWIVLDNLKEGVIKPDVYDPEANRLYRDVLRHYGCSVLPCRPFHPNRKGKVESGVGHAKQTPLKGKRFESLAEAQAYLDRWEERWADTRIHGRTKEQVAKRFELEKPTLLPLPAEPFRYYSFGVRSVHLDGCVEVSGAYYQAPPGLIGSRVRVEWDGGRVRLLDLVTEKLLCEHLPQPRGRFGTIPGQQSRRTPPTTLQALQRAAKAGPNISAVCNAIHTTDGELGVRRILGVLSLAKRHGPAVVEDACICALECGVPTYRFVRRLTERQVESAAQLTQEHPIVRKLDEYCNIIQRIVAREGNAL